METEKIIRVIIDCIDCCDNDGTKARSYSGRGMIDEECLGVDIDGEDYDGGYLGFAIQLPIAVAKYLMEKVDEEGELYSTEEVYDALTEVRNMLSNVKVDSLGMGYIVYFPDIPFKS